MYIHIPFCREACHYCDFHFSISLGHLDHMLNAIAKELSLRIDETGGIKLDTLYFGGGTPSVMSGGQLGDLVSQIRNDYGIDEKAEITLEANPDDLNSNYLDELKEIGINRLSVGIQSFHDDELRLLNRKHDGLQARISLENAAEKGFDNINMDLIYGIPGSGPEKWKKNLELAAKIFPAHISAYHLTYEPGTVLNYRMKRKRFKATGENDSLDQFNVLIDHLKSYGYTHYEISNFARDDKFSKHNLAYWTGEKYFGFGPSAHSYYGHSRRWNIARNTGYIRAITEGKKYFENEVLNTRDQYHDYLLTNLRTHKGINTAYVLEKWGEESLRHLTKQAEVFIDNGKLLKNGNTILLSREGMFISDYILADLFMQT